MSGNVHNPADVTNIQADIDLIEEDANAIREVTDSEPILSEISGQITTDGTEQILYINTAPAGIFRPVVIQIDFTNHTAGETVVLREYYRIAPGGAFIQQDINTYAGVPANPLIKINPEPTRYGIRITIQKTVGTNRAYDWEVFYEEAP